MANIIQGMSNLQAWAGSGMRNVDVSLKSLARGLIGGTGAAARALAAGHMGPLQRYMYGGRMPRKEMFRYRGLLPPDVGAHPWIEEAGGRQQRLFGYGARGKPTMGPSKTGATGRMIYPPVKGGREWYGLAGMGIAAYGGYKAAEMFDVQPKDITDWAGTVGGYAWATRMGGRPGFGRAMAGAAIGRWVGGIF